MSLRQAHHVIDLAQRYVIADAVVAPVTLQRQQHRLAQAGQLHAIRQANEVPRAKAHPRIGQRHKAAIDNEQIGSRSQSVRSIRRPGDIAHDLAHFEKLAEFSGRPVPELMESSSDGKRVCKPVFSAITWSTEIVFSYLRALCASIFAPVSHVSAQTCAWPMPFG